MSINLTFSHAFYNIYNITLICRKYSKFIKEFVEFINDLSITYSICSTQVFDWYVSYIVKEKLFLFKKILDSFMFLV